MKVQRVPEVVCVVPGGQVVVGAVDGMADEIKDGATDSTRDGGTGEGTTDATAEGAAVGVRKFSEVGTTLGDWLGAAITCVGAGEGAIKTGTAFIFTPQ